MVTVNEYLAHRDAEEMGVLYNFLGLSVGLNLNALSSTENEKLMHVILRIAQIMN